MTFCLAMKVTDGLVGIADTRVTTGAEVITARKVSIFEAEHRSIFLMTSGLRSVRDKALIYFEEALEEAEPQPDRLFKVANLFAEQIRRVAEEDRAALVESGLEFNIHALLGGQLARDHGHKLYRIYPQGNWVEIGPATPYQIIGSSAYGKPVLDRTLTHEASMRFALKVGCLAFDSTRISAADVNFPIDVTMYPTGSFRMIQHRYEAEDLAHISQWWQDQLKGLVRALPDEWMDAVMHQLEGAEREAAAEPPSPRLTA